MTWDPNPPLDVILKWPARNEIDPEVRGPEQYIVTGIFGTIATIVVLFRLYTRVFVRRYFGIDDGLIILAWLSAIGIEVCITLGKSDYQWDRHLWDWNIADLQEGSLKILYLSRIFWSSATSCVRLSILCLYWRLLRRLEPSRHYFWILYAVIGFTVLLMLQMVILASVPCRPVSAYWRFSKMQMAGESFYCINDFISMQVAAVTNTVSEIIVAILPMVAVFKLNIDPKQRWNVIGLLSLGFAVATVGIVRCYYLWQNTITYDLTWYASPHWICAEVEIAVAIISACAAPLSAPVARLIRRTKKVSKSITSVARGNSSVIKDDRSNVSTTALSGHRDLGKLEGVSIIDQNDRSEWANEMTKRFDLEGLHVDGLGYTVSIQGPVSNVRRRRTSKLLDGSVRRWNTLTTRKSGDATRAEADDDQAPIELKRSDKSSQIGVRSTRVSDDRISPIGWERTATSSKSGESHHGRSHTNESMKHWTFLDTPQAYDDKC